MHVGGQARIVVKQTPKPCLSRVILNDSICCLTTRKHVGELDMRKYDASVCHFHIFLCECIFSSLYRIVDATCKGPHVGPN